MKISDFNKDHIGKAIQLQETRFNVITDCIITEVEVGEIVVMFYMQENDDTGYKAITWEDLKNYIINGKGKRHYRIFVAWGIVIKRGITSFYNSSFLIFRYALSIIFSIASLSSSSNANIFFIIVFISS
ncbi:hypothetical protein KWU32_13410, partial [Clostridioides difficile]|nr:hypothetical protein [Clostridioides difficile]MBY1019840.1 hypothetical protein [Clostridioides difficile]MBY1284935.1 hypothetical protein [Clostridioides difficile]MBY2212481.1 hypothetical protein [Clostridioides difficile]MBY2272263.1 hypothetical protein [Clostridioides difficile]